MMPYISTGRALRISISLEGKGSSFLTCQHFCQFEKKKKVLKTIGNGFLFS